MTAYYNEIDPKAAAWLRELIKEGLIADGDVDERSIEDVTPNDVAGYAQCHWFAGIAVWSYALRLAGWPDDRPAWTGSCPCQPFSTAGKGKGFADERHLWPSWHWLIKQCRPDVVFGEQVAGKGGEAWLDAVSTDMEGEAYRIGATVTAACGFGAPHQRKRLYWVADADETGCSGSEREGETDQERKPGRYGPKCSSKDGGLGNAPSSGQQRTEYTPSRQQSDLPGTGHEQTFSEHNIPCPTNGHWRDADWLGCTDRKWRAVEPGTFPLAHGSPERVGRLRCYGNGLVAQQAKAFIEAYLEVEDS